MNASIIARSNAIRACLADQGYTDFDIAVGDDGVARIVFASIKSDEFLTGAANHLESAGFEKHDLGITVDHDISYIDILPVRPIGLYVVDDTSTRTTTVALFDGSKWWLVGSELAHPASAFIGSGRFHVKHTVGIDPHFCSTWKPESGRFH